MAIKKSDLVFYTVVGLVVLPFVLPLAWMVTSSLRLPGLPPPRGVEWWPQPLAWSNYLAIFRLAPLGRYLFNSTLVAALGTLLTLLVASWAGFGMAQLHRPGGRATRFLLGLSVVMLLVPLTALWLGRFVIFNALGWIDSYMALLAPALMGASPFFVLLYYRAFRRVSFETFEAARLEGAGVLALWRRIAMPQVIHTTTAVAVLSFIFFWNDFLNPLIYLKSPARYTLAVGLQQLQQLDRTNWPLLLAGAVVMTVPVIGLFLLVQRYLLNE